MEFIKVFLIALILVLLAFLGLALRILFLKGGKFPDSHISGNKHLKDQGIYCAQTQDRMEQRRIRNEVDYKNLKVADTKNKY